MLLSLRLVLPKAAKVKPCSFHVLLHERDNEHPNLLKLFVMFVGFALIGGIRLFEGEHGHSHNDNHHTSFENGSLIPDVHGH